MKTFINLLALMSILVVPACNSKHLITDKEYLDIIEKSFNERKQIANNREIALFSIFNQELSITQTEALKFLFAFMPLNDLADYNGAFFLANIDISLRTKNETIWGKDIPEDIFLHYVLPCRINNENLDSFRIVYYNEILDRVRDKDIREAALEINHWCHEKVSYQPADSRTSSPMSTILSSRGRCGEESTFTVAALRTAGIPARQVYTPRWAHSDDNHAWVEVWIDGEWYYMGACEPEPELDQGWFTEPARRAMLVHTKSFGAPTGNENSIISNKNYTEVNNLSKYAVTKKIFVKAFDKDSVPIKNAIIEYKLYNYAEFYPIAIVPTDENGISQFESGLGDLLIWASHNSDFNYKKISVSETDTLVLILSRNGNDTYSSVLDLDVPVIRSPLPIQSPELIGQNLKRINTENIIRQKYIDSWMNPEEARNLAQSLNVDTAKTMNVIARSMGNYNEIRSFLTNTPDSLRTLALTLLEILPDKDLRDTKGYILSDHLKYSVHRLYVAGKPGNKIFVNFILNPRIANEIIIAWRSYFVENLPSEVKEKAPADPSIIVKYVDENIKIDNEENYYKTPLTPKGVHELKVSDNSSRSIFFVAICRSLGIPSRLEPGSNVPQYFLDEEWNNVYFADQQQPAKNNGYLRLLSTETNPVPEYYIHFTIARLENGRYNTLEYDYNKKITDFKEELALPPGNYLLVTGNRLNDSKILSDISFFNLSEDEHKTVQVTLRKEVSFNKVAGKIDLLKIVNLFDSQNISSERIIDKGVVILWIDPEMEPTKHIFNDLPLLKNELDSWGGYFLFLSGSSQENVGFKSEGLLGLPSNCLFGIDSNFGALDNILKNKPLSNIRLPHIVMADKDGNIMFTSTGYRIGIGEQILKNVK